MDTLNRILDLILNNFPSDAAFEDALNIKRKTVDSWKRNNSKSYLNKIVEISKVFHVSTDYLLTGEKSILLRDDENEILEKYNNLNTRAQGKAIQQIDDLLKDTRNLACVASAELKQAI